jgi:hypothetical protein
MGGAAVASRPSGSDSRPAREIGVAAAVEIGVETGVEVGVETDVEVGVETGVEVGVENCVEAGGAAGASSNADVPDRPSTAASNIGAGGAGVGDWGSLASEGKSSRAVIESSHETTRAPRESGHPSGSLFGTRSTATEFTLYTGGRQV